MASRNEKRPATITAAYIGGVALILGTILTAFLTPVGKKVGDWFSARPDGSWPQPQPLVVQAETDESLRAEGCQIPRSGKCLACEKDVSFSKEAGGNILARTTCKNMPEDIDVRVSFKGYVITDNPPPDPNGGRQKWNTDVTLFLGFDSPAEEEANQRHVGGPIDWATFNFESIKKAPHSKTAAAHLKLVTCQSGTTPDSCSTMGPAKLRIEAVTNQ